MIYIAKQYRVVKQEGNPDGFFDADHVQDKGTMDNEGNFLPKIDLHVFFALNHAEDIALVHNQGCNVDDDNRPAPENVPDTTAPLSLDNKELFEGQHWGVDHHVDPMELHGSKMTPSFKEFDLTRSVSISIFMKLFPWKWLRLILPVQTSKNLEQEVHWGEQMCYLGLWFLNSSSVGGGYKKKDFWIPQPFEREQIPAATTSVSICRPKVLMPSPPRSVSRMLTSPPTGTSFGKFGR
jgi:hypothetical protein